MAESISYYVENPMKLQTCCIEKYEFIRDRIMHGYRYISQLKKQVTFQVFNLFPDFVYPGKIIKVDITIQGKPHQDKRCTVTIQLNTLGGVFDGAKHAYFRLYSEIGTDSDHYLSPKQVSYCTRLSRHECTCSQQCATDTSFCVSLRIDLSLSLSVSSSSSLSIY